MPRPHFSSIVKQPAILFIALALLVIGVAASIYSFRRPPQLNVILITLDTTRADHLGAYGYRQGLTAAFDDLAQHGVLFDHAYAPAPITLPSHATMLTGLHPPEHGLRVNGGGSLAKETPLLPEMLKKHGYETAAFIAAFVLHSKFGLSRGFDVYDDNFSQDTISAHGGDRRRDGREIVDAASQWLKQRTSRPFFCWIHLYDAHSEYDSRPGLFGDRFEHNPYDAGVAVEIEQLGRVMTLLKERKLDKNTLIVVAGDHGEGLCDHLEVDHGMYAYNSTLRVPLVFAGSSGCQPGHRVPNSVSLVDLVPTILDLLCLPVPQHISGQTLRPALMGDTIPARTCYAESETPYLDNYWCPIHVAIRDEWKYLQTTRPELYNLEQDPEELTNLADSHPDERKTMQNILETMQATFVPAVTQNLPLTAKDAAILDSLGYVAGGKVASPTDLAQTEALPDLKDMMPHFLKLQRARSLFVEGQLDQAATLAEEVIVETDKMPVAYLFLGDVLNKQGHYREATDSLRTLVEKQPDNVKARERLAVLLAKQDLLEEAVTEFREIIRQSPEIPQTHFELAQTLSQQKKLEPAIAEFREAIRLEPELIAAHFHLGMLLASLKRPNEAVVCFENALKVQPRFAPAYLNLASALLQLGQFQRALEAAQKAVELEPNSFEGRFNLGMILTNQKRLDEALVQFREAQKLRPDDPRPVQRIQQTESALRQIRK